MNGKLRFIAQAGATALIAASLGGCLGQTSDKTAATTPPAAAVEKPALAEVADTRSLEELAKAVLADAKKLGVPLPLPAPRHSVAVASIDPAAGLSALRPSAPMAATGNELADYRAAVQWASSNPLKTPRNVRQALKQLKFTDPAPLAESWLNEQATIAAKNKAFAEGVRGQIRSHSRQEVLALIASDVGYVFNIPGAGEAMADIVSHVSVEDREMAALSARLHDTSYALQRSKWGMIEPLQPAGSLGTAPVKTASVSWSDRLKGIAAELSPVTPAQAYSVSVMHQIMATAARRIIDPDQPVEVSAKRSDTARCLNWARLNLAQCIAAAHFPSEEAYCTGKHAVEEVRQCWAEVLPPSGN